MRHPSASALNRCGRIDSIGSIEVHVRDPGSERSYPRVEVEQVQGADTHKRLRTLSARFRD
jgi:hypothetical protein